MQPRARPHAAQPREAKHGHSPHEGSECDDEHELHRTRILETEVTQEIALSLNVETDDTALPLIVDRVQLQPQAFQPGHFHAGKVGHGFTRRQRGTQSPLDARRCDRAGWIEASPLAIDDCLGPRMRVGLTDDHVFPIGRHLATLIPRDDARGNAGRAKEHHEGAGVVLAKTATRIEKERIHRIGAVERWRCQRIDVGFLMKPLKDRRDIGLVGIDTRAKIARKRCGAGVVAGQLQIVGCIPGHGQHAATQHGPLNVAHGLRDGGAGEQLLIVREEGDVVDGSGTDDVVGRWPWQSCRMFECKQPELAVRFKRDRVVDGRALALREFAGLQAKGGAPLATVEAREHRTAPVAFAGWRGRSAKVDSESYRVG